MKRRGGFTSVELIVVLEIIAILGVVALLVFFNIQSNARQVSIENLKVAMEKAASLVHGKAALVGVEGIEKSVVFDIDTAYGYPSIRGITKAVENFEQDWEVFDALSSSQETIAVSFKGYDLMAKNRCHLTYTQASGIEIPPVVRVFCEE